MIFHKTSATTELFQAPRTLLVLQIIIISNENNILGVVISVHFTVLAVAVHSWQEVFWRQNSHCRNRLSGCSKGMQNSFSVNNSGAFAVKYNLHFPVGFTISDSLVVSCFLNRHFPSTETKKTIFYFFGFQLSRLNLTLTCRKFNRLWG